MTRDTSPGAGKDRPSDRRKRVTVGVRDMLAILESESATEDEKDAAAATIVEAVAPDIMEKAYGDESKAWDGPLACDPGVYRRPPNDAAPRRKIIESWKHKTLVNETGTARLVEGGRLGCLDCGEIYGSPRFPDLVIDNAAWKAIAPNHDEGGLLCPNCICARLELAGLENVIGAFRSGPLALTTAARAAQSEEGK